MSFSQLSFIISRPASKYYLTDFCPCRWAADHQKKSVWREEEDEEESVPMLQQDHLQADTEESEDELLVRTEAGNSERQFVNITIQS